jgi:predicted ferric reductase
MVAEDACLQVVEYVHDADGATVGLEMTLGHGSNSAGIPHSNSSAAESSVFSTRAQTLGTGSFGGDKRKKSSAIDDDDVDELDIDGPPRHYENVFHCKANSTSLAQDYHGEGIEMARRSTSTSTDDDSTLQNPWRPGRAVHARLSALCWKDLATYTSIYYPKVLRSAAMIMLFWFSYVTVICDSTYFWNAENSAYLNPLLIYVREPLMSTISFTRTWEVNHYGFPMWPPTFLLTILIIIIPAMLMAFPPSDTDTTGSSTDPVRAQPQQPVQPWQAWLRRRGDPSMRVWSIVLLVIPTATVLFIMLFKPIPDEIQATLNGLIFQVTTQLITSWANAAGYVAVVALSFFLVPVSKQSPLLSLLGLSPTLAVGFHNWAGRICWITSSIHAILHTIQIAFGDPKRGMMEILITELFPVESKCRTWQSPAAFRIVVSDEAYCYRQWRNLTGIISSVALLILVMTSWNFVRRRYYWLFYRCHVIFGSIMMVFAMLHFYFVAIYLMPGIIYYLVCLIPEKLRQLIDWTGGRSIQVRNVIPIANSNGCFELQLASVSQPRHHPAYVNICVPEISSFQWHPFTVAHSTPREFRLLIRDLGPFSEALRQQLTSRIPTTVLVDGFYDSGPNWVKEALEYHDTSLFVMAGIGVTPLLPVLLGIWKELSSSSGHAPVSIHVHWYCRDETLVNHVWAHYVKPIMEMEDRGSYTLAEQNRQLSWIRFTVHLTSSHSQCDDELVDDGLEQEETDGDVGNESDRDHLKPNDQSHRKHPFQLPARQAARHASILMLITYAMYVWIYHDETWEYRHRIFFRSYSLLFSGAMIILGSLLSELSTRLLTTHYEHRQLIPENDDDRVEENAFGVSAVEEAVTRKGAGNYNGKGPALAEIKRETCNFAFEVSTGRPSLTEVIRPVVESTSPAVFFCGPDSLSIELDGRIAEARRARHGFFSRHCAWFKEHFEL